jgi:hypothetical protein
MHACCSVFSLLIAGLLLLLILLPVCCCCCPCCRSVAQERSLLTGEVGMVTIKMMGSVGKLDGFNSAARFLGQVSRMTSCILPAWRQSDDLELSCG